MSYGGELPSPRRKIPGVLLVERALYDAETEMGVSFRFLPGLLVSAPSPPLFFYIYYTCIVKLRTV